MKLVFRDLFLFSTSEGLAKKITFEDGINVVTSSQENGTDRGKSVIMRSLYHTLGADAKFDDKWDTKNKIYILRFSIDSKEYYIYRSHRLFKFFDDKKNLLFSTIERQKLSELLEPYFDFIVQLPNRNEDELETTPPVYSYLPYYLDQDYYNGTSFSSFSGLGQYANYKENVLYYHFGAFDKRYFEIVKELERLDKEKSKLGKREVIVEEMLLNIFEKLDGITYSKDIDSLKLEVQFLEKEYSEITQHLAKVKKKILQLKNERYDLEASLKQLSILEKKNNSEIVSLTKHICPYCKSKLLDDDNLRIERYNIGDDIILMSNDMQKSILDLENKIDTELGEYKEYLKLLESYKEKLRISTSQIDSVLKHEGLIELQKDLLSEKLELSSELNIKRITEENLNKERKKYNEIKKKINNEYYKLLFDDKIKFNLTEIDESRFENIKINFSASGSNKPIATVIWYCTLIKLKNIFNKNAIKFPRVFDSPNNAETDDIKKHELFSYLLDNATDENQLIISCIGFEKKDFVCEKKINIIRLENEKYHLLNRKDYFESKHLLIELCSKQ